MKTLIKSTFVLCLIFLGAHAAFAACGDSITGGTGTSTSPYQIDDASELAAVSNCTGAGNASKYFKVMNDISLNVSPYNTGSGWTPIGSSGSPFYGKFNGSNHIISNLFISRGSTSYVGLFGFVASGAIIERTYLNNVNVDGGGSYVGALAGYSAGTIRNSGVNNGTVTGLTRLGGVVGSVRDGGVFQRGYSVGLTVTQKAAGSDCCVGGLAGAVEFTGSMSNSLSHSNVVHTSSGQGVLGGAIGSTFNGTSVSNIFSTGTVTTLSSYPVQVGGLGGNSGVSATNSYWNTQTSGWATSGIGVGKTTSEMQDQNTYTGWDFTNIWTTFGSYPILRPDIEDSTAPTISTLSPADNASPATISDNLVITFSESVNKGTGNIVIYKSSDNSIVETINVTSGQVTGGGTSTISINPTTNFEMGTSYYVQIASTAFTDAAANAFAGISNATTWNFTTGTYNLPTLVYPMDGQRMTALYVHTSINETALTGTLVITLAGSTNYTITLNDLAVGEHVFTIPFSNPLLASEVLSSSPSGSLADGVYTMTLSHRDATNTSTLSTTPISITFDTVAPTLSTLSPADNATGVNLNPNLVMTFSEAVIKNSGVVSIYKTSDNSLVESINVISPNIYGNETVTMTISPTVNLLANTGYYVRVDGAAFRDLVGNSYAGISTSTAWNFTTGNYVAPVLTTVTPIASSTTAANARYHFTTSAVCDFLATEPVSNLTGEILETRFSSSGVPSTDITAYIGGIQVGGTYSFSFQCRDADLNSSNSISVGPFTVVAPPSTAQNTVVTGGYLAPKSQTGITASAGGMLAKIARSLKLNMRGNDVRMLQQWLNKNGFVVASSGAGSPGKENNQFGLMTKKAVMKFQMSKGLKSDGIVGPKTAALMTDN